MNWFLVVALLQHCHAEQPRIEVDGAFEVGDAQHRVREPEGGCIDGLVAFGQHLVREDLRESRLDGLADMGVGGLDAGVLELLRRHRPDLGDQQDFAIGEHAAHRFARVFVLAQRVVGGAPAVDKRRAFGRHIVNQELLALAEMQVDGGAVAACDRDAKGIACGGGFGGWAFEHIGRHWRSLQRRNLKGLTATFVPYAIS